MNPTLDLLRSHGSSRSFLDKPIDEAAIDAMVAAAQQAPNSHNGQQVSLVLVRDAETRRAIAELSGGQPHVAKAPLFIAVVIDYNKTAQALALHGKVHRFDQSVEGLIAGSVDVGIQIATLMTAARSLQLGAVAIGGIRNDLPALNALLGLPDRCTAITGLCVGHVANAAPIKPRLGVKSFRHDERYDAAAIAPEIVAYDRLLVDYWAKVGRKDGESWSESLASHYDSERYPLSYDAFATAGLFGLPTRAPGDLSQNRVTFARNPEDQKEYPDEHA